MAAFLSFCIGIFIAFNYWNYAVEKLIYKNHHFLDNDFKKDAVIQKATYSFLDLDSERMSGVISFLLLNILLVFLSSLIIMNSSTKLQKHRFSCQKKHMRESMQ